MNLNNSHFKVHILKWQIDELPSNCMHIQIQVEYTSLHLLSKWCKEVVRVQINHTKVCKNKLKTN